MTNLAQRFFETAARQPEHPLVLGQTPDELTTYAAFAAEVRRLAAELEVAGVGPGSNIGLHHRSGKDYIALVYAVWTAGGCITPLPLELTPTEKHNIFEHIHMDAVISEARLFDQISAQVVTETATVGVTSVLARVDSSVALPPELRSVDAAFIRFTSGTTGDAKGVVLSHASIYTRIHAANRVLEVGPHDRILWLLSMDYHFAVSIVSYLTFGASIVLPRNTFGVTLLKAATAHRATFIYGAPIHYSLMTQDDTGAELPRELRLAIVTTTALKATAADAFYSRFGRVLNETYGIIELGLPAINISHDRAKQGSVGRVVPGYDLTIEPIEGEGEGEGEGEITVRAEGMLDAYYAPWRSREAILAEHGGRFRTGDLGRLDEDGYLHIVGRIKELISVGGLKFFPSEVDAVLEAHPAVRSACVFGEQERQWGSTVSARLVLEDGCEAPDRATLRAWCHASLANYKVPDSFEWVDALTYTASGKKIRNPARHLSTRD